MKSPLSLGELLSTLDPGSRVLDLGCGGGTFRYADFPSIVIHALDEAAHEKTRSFPPHVHFIRAGATSIPERNEAFDLVVVNFAFEHFPDPVAALREIARVAKDRAHVWISIPNAGSFEDQLYRNLFAGGGHLQSPTLERFLRLVYENTCLKLASFLELPAGFTFLGDSEELRHLTWAIIDALKKSVAIEAQSQSGYIFVLRKYEEAGPGFKQFLRTCHACGSPDEAREGAEAIPSAPWECRTCGAKNDTPLELQAVRLDKVERAQRLQWQRYPETHPARLKEMVEERGRWGQALERDLESARRREAELAEECDRRGRWAMDLQRDLERLQTEFDERGRWAQELDQTVKRQQAELLQLRTPIGYLKNTWKIIRRRLLRQRQVN